MQLHILGFFAPSATRPEFKQPCPQQSLFGTGSLSLSRELRRAWQPQNLSLRVGVPHAEGSEVHRFSGACKLFEVLGVFHTTGTHGRTQLL